MNQIDEEIQQIISKIKKSEDQEEINKLLEELENKFEVQNEHTKVQITQLKSEIHRLSGL